MAIQHPLSAHNGEQIWYDADLLDKLRYGDPISGWSGDINMSLIYNNLDHKTYLVSRDDNANEYIIAVSKPDMNINSMNLLNMLVAHDRNRRGGYNAGKEMDDIDAKILADKKARDDDEIEEVAKKLAWGFKKDMN